MVKEIDKSI